MGRSRAQTGFREAKPPDVADLVDIERRCFQSYYRPHRFDDKAFHYYLRLPGSITEVALRGGRLVGYVLGIVQHGRLRRIARLYSLAVLAQARGGGIGGRLLRDFMKRARARGARRVRLEVAVRNAAARGLFERAGFRSVARLKDYYGARIDALLMTRNL